jgi:hypothetical protein
MVSACFRRVIFACNTFCHREFLLPTALDRFLLAKCRGLEYFATIAVMKLGKGDGRAEEAN